MRYALSILKRAGLSGTMEQLFTQTMEDLTGPLKIVGQRRPLLASVLPVIMLDGQLDCIQSLEQLMREIIGKNG